MLDLDLALEDLALPLLVVRLPLVELGMTSVANSSRDSRMWASVFLPAWFRRMTWSMLVSSNFRSRSRIVSGEPMRPPLDLAALPGSAFHFWYSSQRLTVPGSTTP